MDHAMVTAVLRRLGELSLIVQLGIVAAIALAGLFWIKGSGELVDLFLTDDQQGRFQYEKPRFAEAADKFVDPAWKGTAQFRSGQYLEAADTFARMGSAE